MKKLKKALSLTLALALSLSLAVPSFAAGSWNLSVQGKTSEETALPTATYTLRDWHLVWDEESQGYTVSLVETRNAEAEGLIGLMRGDTIAITGSTQGMIDVQAFSDPDGDGVYDQRIMCFPYEGDEYVLPLPYKDGEVHNDFYDTVEVFPTMHLRGNGSFGWGIEVNQTWWELDEDVDGWIDFTVSADRLFQYFGPNTIVVFIAMDEELGWEGDKGWNVFLMDDSQPTTPAEPEQPDVPAEPEQPTTPAEPEQPTTPAEPEQPTTPAEPEQPTVPSAPVPTSVILSLQKLAVDGKDVDCEKYNIDGRNYFKLRDLASLLSGTGSQFEVGYDEATATVSITTGQAYTPNGNELAAGVDNSGSTIPSSQAIVINGEKNSELTVYNIGGSNFFQLRELGNVLGFEVDYDQDTNTAIVNSVQK